MALRHKNSYNGRNVDFENKRGEIDNGRELTKQIADNRQRWAGSCSTDFYFLSAINL